MTHDAKFCRNMFHYSVVLLSSVILFLYGFFPITNNNETFSNDPPVYIGNISLDIEEIYRPHFQKTILIVIDALRWDFATSELLPLSMGHMNKKGCISKVSVESPTVTLPRIKALTTGSIPQYIDLVKNLASSEILVDSWLHSAKNKGLKTVFYGDNTWEKLFPNFFTRSEGTTSFFVWDFTEVDDNVTRNVDLELERKDWDIMILHYLGLDHIGHVLGPFSSKMPPKLMEMDGVINAIFEKTIDSDTLILVTGDHGMRDGGGHGGTSHPEVTVPLITIGHNCQSSSFLQTDIPANLAVLLGLDIPSTSIGKIQKEFVNNLNTVQHLYALRYNTEILLKKSSLCENSFENATYFHEMYLTSNDSTYADLALHFYQECSERITKNLYEASSKQDIPSLLLAVLVLCNLLILLTLNLLNRGSQTRHNLELLIYSCILLMQFFLAIEEMWNISMLILVILAVMKLKTLFGALHILRNCSSMQKYLVLICIVHPITFISTSFIEEEHYFWIFFTVTSVILHFIQKSAEKPIIRVSSVKIFIVLILLRFSMDLNSTLENSVQNEDNWANLLMAEENYLYHQIFFAFGIILVYFTIYSKQKTSSNMILNMCNFFVLVLIYVLKSVPYHNTFLGKLIWGTIFFQIICFREFAWKQFWILSTTLLIKPHNVVLISFAVYTGDLLCNLNNFENVSALTVVSYMLSNCFYFLQGQRNSLASVDISIGYTGLNDYYPVLVISQVLIHTYIFPVLFHLIVLQQIPERYKQNIFWRTLLTLRASVIFFMGIVMIIFRHHLFIWSVFAPKLFIESIHTSFLFIEICFWYCSNYIKRLVSLL